MTTGDYSPLLRDGSSRSSTAQHHLPIHAHYYDITDIESWPIAGLLVLLDGQQQPVRAELHLYDGLEPHVQDAAIRQARLVLQESHLGGDPVPVRILETMQVREEMLVRLPPVGTRPMNHVTALPLGQWRPYGLAAVGVLLVVALIWMAVALLGGRGDPEGNAVVPSAPDSANQLVAEAQEEAPIDTGGGAVSETEASNVPVVSSGELSPSRNARSDLGIGVPVQVVPGLQLALRSEPGVDRGLVIGALTDGVVATIIGGPEYRAGDTDTIVWWFVELDNGTQAWAAANTSDQTLLMPAQ
ncbi:MAG: hypothetical protein IT328_26540 [Caldilineaceae bacterium]|nr:hypothetical protein [Caldilineaceae bacterium]